MIGNKPDRQGFFFGAKHVGGSFGYYRRLKKLALQLVAPGQQFAALGNGVSHVALHLVNGGVFNQRALRHAVLKPVADLEQLPESVSRFPARPIFG